MRSFSFYHASRSVLNSSLDDIDIRYNSTTGKPEWRERGAGTFVPFSSSPIKGIFSTWSTSTDYLNWYYIDAENSKFYSGANKSGKQDLLDKCDLISDCFYNYGLPWVVIAKSGYYSTGTNVGAYSSESAITGVIYSEGSSPSLNLTYHEAGETIQGFRNYQLHLVYWGETNPFE